MPYKLKKSGSGWKVGKKHGSKTFSKKPMSKERAKAQMRAIYANTDESFARRVDKILEEISEARRNATYPGQVINNSGREYQVVLTFQTIEMAMQFERFVHKRNLGSATQADNEVLYMTTDKEMFDSCLKNMRLRGVKIDLA